MYWCIADPVLLGDRSVWFPRVPYRERVTGQRVPRPSVRSVALSVYISNSPHVSSTARGTKVGDLQKRLAWAGAAFEVVSIVDLATDQFPESLKGVDAIIHAGSPLSGRDEPEEMLKVWC
jgi:hypothetical protein